MRILPVVLELLLGRLEKLLNCGAKKIKVDLINKLINNYHCDVITCAKAASYGKQKEGSDVIYYISIIARASFVSWPSWGGRKDGRTSLL